MNALPKITVTVITLNEEENIKECLEGVKWADEIIASDSGSIDKTTGILKAYGAKVFTDEWRGYGRQKNLCAERARNDWILNVDADERITPALAEEISGALEDGGKAGYYMPRKNYFGDVWVRHCGWYPDFNLRLYRRDKGAFNERLVHEAVTVEGETGRLKNPLIHKTYRDVPDYLKRMERYASLSAEEMSKNGRQAGPIDLYLRPAFTFLKMYALKLGFLDGGVGFTLSRLYARYTFLKYSKLRGLTEGQGRIRP